LYNKFYRFFLKSGSLFRQHRATFWLTFILAYTALKTSEKLNSVVEAYFNVTISDEKLAEVKEEIKLSAADVNKKQKKAKAYHIQRGGMPFEGCAMTNSRKAIREILRYKCLSELKVI